jgi:glycosyltransferase involved in cell wall biosynthesis
MRVLHVITGLRTGGAEMMLLKLLSSYQKSPIRSVVVSLTDRGTVGARIATLGVPVFALGLTKKRPLIGAAISRLRQICTDFSPSLIQGWMYHGNLAATLTSWLQRKKSPVVWNVRASFYGFSGMPMNTAMAIRLGAILSGKPAAIIYNSELSSRQHEAQGYSGRRRIVIPNGFDCAAFRPSSAARRRLRAELGLAPDAAIVGLIGRFHPMKDHENFIRAAALLDRRGRSAAYVLVGQGLDASNRVVMGMLHKHGMQNRVFLLGERQNVAELTAALDVACSASAWGEGFSNTIGEAMACGIPCVVTDVGDSRHIVGKGGTVVPARDALALGDAIGQLLEAGPDFRSEMGANARRRVQQLFSLDVVTMEYETLYRNLLKHSPVELKE